MADDRITSPGTALEAGAILIRYDEVALKGGNRSWFEKKLANNLKQMIKRELGPGTVATERQYGRILVRTQWNQAVRDAVSRTFGVSSFSPMWIVPTDPEALEKAALEVFNRHVSEHGMPADFRIRTRRSDKALPQTSLELDRGLGAVILKAHDGKGLRVKLENPECTVGVEIRAGKSFLWTETLPGPRGLPAGTNSRVLTLLSGGLDSPVAAYQIMKRGATTDFIHFHGTPFVGDEVLTKVEDLVRKVNRWTSHRQRLHVVPFGKIQEKIALVTDAKLRTVLYRRMMIRIACALAERIDARALVTGEALGQVASQTVENLSTVDESSTLPILRPLIAHDKYEIVALTEKLDTFGISTRPGVDCCTLFADRHPSIRTPLHVARSEEKKFDTETLVAEALDGAYTIEIENKSI